MDPHPQPQSYPGMLPGSAQNPEMEEPPQPGVARRWTKKVTYVSPEGIEIKSASQMSDYNSKYHGGPAVPNSQWEEEVIVVQDLHTEFAEEGQKKELTEKEHERRGQERKKKVKYDVDNCAIDKLSEDVICAIQCLLTTEDILKASIALSWKEDTSYIVLDPRRVSVNGTEVIGTESFAWRNDRIHGFVSYGIKLLDRMRKGEVSQLCLHIPRSYNKFRWAFENLLHEASKIDIAAVKITSNMDMDEGDGVIGTISLLPRGVLRTGVLSTGAKGLKILQLQCCGALTFKGDKLSFPVLETVTLHGLLLHDEVCLPLFIDSCPKMRVLDIDLQRNEDVDVIDTSSESMERLIINLVGPTCTLVCRSPKLERLSFKYSGFEHHRIAMDAPDLQELLISVTSNSWCFLELHSLDPSYERFKELDPDSFCGELRVISRLRIATILTYFDSSQPPDDQTKDEFRELADRLVEQIREVEEIRYVQFKEVISTCGLSLPDSAKQVAIK